MIRHFVRMCMGQILRHRMLSFINIGGLAAGLLCCLFIALFIRHEWSYDRFFTRADDIYRLAYEISLADGTTMNYSSVPSPVASLLQQYFPQVTAVNRLRTGRVAIRFEDVEFAEELVNRVDPDFFSMFDFQWLDGDKASALVEPDRLVMTQSAATRYFGDANPLGQILQIDDERSLTVAGIIADLPSNTHFTGELFSSYEPTVAPNPAVSPWWIASDFTYFVLEEDADIEDLQRRLPDFLEQYGIQPPDADSAMQALPLVDIHLKSRSQFEMKPPGNPVLLYAMLATGAGILIIACLNFVNITTARASRRGRDVGVRKVLGATRRNLVVQHLFESVMLCGFAMILAVAGVELLMPVFNQVFGLNLQAGLLGLDFVAVSLVLGVVVLGVVAGWYPALYLSSFRPSLILKGLTPLEYRGVVFRGVLVTAQFTIVIILVAGTVGIRSQLAFIEKLNLGFQKEKILLVNAVGESFSDHYVRFRDTLLQHPDVAMVTSSLSSPLRIESQSMSAFAVQGSSTGIFMPVISFDRDYFELYEIALLAGRHISPEMQSDRIDSARERVNGAVVLNERAAGMFGWSVEDAVGEIVSLANNTQRYEVVGVVANTLESARVEANPHVYVLRGGNAAGGVVSVRLEAENADEVLGFIDSTWNEIYPAEPIRRRFLDDAINSLYLDDGRKLRLVSVFAILSITLACLGLYGLASFNAESRVREIGIRKVMGGSVWSIVVLLTNDFSRLVLLANLIAWPVAYIAMSRWLEGFAYRIDLTPMIFIGSGLIALCIAWVTVGGTAAKAASAKPVLALRYE